MRRTILVLCLGIVPACSTNDVVDTVYDPCSPLTISVTDDVGPEERLGIEEAIVTWSHVLPTKIVVGSGPKAVDVLPLRFLPGQPFFRGIYWDGPGEIEIGRDLLAPEDYPLAIAHEMGHAFGLLHVPKKERLSVMNVHNLEISPNEEDAAAVRALWATCGDSPPAD